MEVKEAVLYQATKMFNWTEDEAKEKLMEGDELKPDYADVILEADKVRVQKLRDERTDKYNEGYQTAEKKFKTIAEAEFKELTGYKGTEGNFKEMFQLWFTEEKKKLSQKKELNEDDIKRHPLYIDLETKTIPKSQYDELQKSFDEFKTTQQRSQVMGVVTERAWSVVAAKNPILSENQTVAENRKRDFLAKFSGYDYDLQDGKIIVLKDGKRLEDEHGNLKPFEAVVLGLANLNFDFRAQGEKGNGGNENKSGGTSGVVLTDKPTTAAEYHAALDKWNGASEDQVKMRIALKAYYHANKKD
jgi:hypothetical protein